MQFSVTITNEAPAVKIPCLGPGVYLLTAFAYASVENTSSEDPAALEIQLIESTLAAVWSSIAPSFSGSLGQPLSPRTTIVVVAEPVASLTAFASASLVWSAEVTICLERLI